MNAHPSPHFSGQYSNTLNELVDNVVSARQNIIRGLGCFDGDPELIIYVDISQWYAIKSIDNLAYHTEKAGGECSFMGYRVIKVLEDNYTHIVHLSDNSKPITSTQ